MNDLKASNDFKFALERLLQRMQRAVSVDGLVAYAGEPDGKLLEHTTREFFLDGLLKALGWTLGPEGNMAAEARIKAETTIYMDYVGVAAPTRNPLFVVEAKAWDKPFVAARLTRSKSDPSELIIKAIAHLKAGGEKQASPVIGLWHDYIEQVRNYLLKLKKNDDHDLARVLLTSGSWMVIFEHPTKTFLESGAVDADDFMLLRMDEYVSRSTDILDLLGRSKISADVPSTLRPSQLSTYVKPSDVKAVFHALHVKYEETGSKRFTPRPRVIVYPAIIIQRKDDVLLQTLQEEYASDLNSGEEGIKAHLSDIETGAVALLAECSRQLGNDLSISALPLFPGFPPRTRKARSSTRRALVDDFDSVSNEWVLLTGAFKHYLHEWPKFRSCTYHSWEGCNLVGSQIGDRAESVRRVGDPRVFFIDHQEHHCAHIEMMDKKDDRCLIQAIDERTCCQACIYLETCWSESERRLLPCGGRP